MHKYSQTVYTSAIWGVIFWPPQDKPINRTGGVEEMNWGGWTPQPPRQFPHWIPPYVKVHDEPSRRYFNDLCRHFIYLGNWIDWTTLGRWMASWAWPWPCKIVYRIAPPPLVSTYSTENALHRESVYSITSNYGSRFFWNFFKILCVLGNLR